MASEFWLSDRQWAAMAPLLPTNQSGARRVDDRRVISLSSNDYLGLSHHPRMKRAAIEAVERYGAGSGAVRTIAGNMTLHEELEADLATFKHTGGVSAFKAKLVDGMVANGYERDFADKSFRQLEGLGS